MNKPIVPFAERCQRVLVLHEQGKTDREIAEGEGISLRRARHCLLANGIQSDFITNQVARKAAINAERVMKDPQGTAKRFGVSPSTVGKYWSEARDDLPVEETAGEVEPEVSTDIVRWPINDTFVSLPRVLGVDRVTA